MTQLTLSKSNYLKESKRLASYERYLPSLDLKRKQLLANKSKEQAALACLQKQSDDLMADVDTLFPMLRNCRFSLEGLVNVDKVVVTEENMMGIHLPKFERITVSVKRYGLMTKPIWLDMLCNKLKRACEIHTKLNVQARRVKILETAVRKATQRVNLVSEILMPETRKNMRKIKIFLSDNERVSVVRSKIAKKKKQQQGDMDVTGRSGAA